MRYNPDCGDPKQCILHFGKSHIGNKAGSELLIVLKIDKQTQTRVFGGFLKLGVPYWGPYKKDYSILGLTLRSPILGNYHFSWLSRSTGCLFEALKAPDVSLLRPQDP